MVYRRASQGRSNFGGRRVSRRGGGFRWQIMLLFAVGAAIYYFVNQEEVPFTGRQQLRTMEPAQEMQLGLQSYRQILADSQVVTNEPVVDVVREIGARIARAAAPEDPGFEWAFNVIDSPQVNAFALPGGYTAVYTGLIPVAQTEDGLAVVMGHEVGHALAHHGAERMAQQNMQRIVGTGVALGAGGMDQTAQRTVMGVFGGISQYGYALPFSRAHESEADYIGLILMARACYDPREAPRLWERMAAAGGATPPEFQSTHPSPETRINDFETWMPEAVEIYNQNCPNDISLR
ncbi:peptidase M48 [Algimonas ampicilliniresistens]|jgi:predicted Zn-dependent protease|uniref:Peptidase M48 n=1 Tax=Algimonas ampicilliniresistens TaxID=1298735 RepID=A0ABQ5VC37_9PROT|nr:M48 family metallopeptidase [Algimonas ampicilliniresistens]GLQ24973.1 peptidase M48 [Algimonas ampicilliniresistens]